MKDTVEQAKKDGKGVPAFNIHALEVVPMMAKTAAEKECPVILQVSVSTAKYIGFRLLSTIVKEIAASLGISDSSYLRKNILGNLVSAGCLVEMTIGRSKAYKTNPESVRIL